MNISIPTGTIKSVDVIAYYLARYFQLTGTIKSTLPGSINTSSA